MGTQERVEVTEMFILFMFEVEDNYGALAKVWACGIEDIMPDPNPVDLQSVRKLFSHVPNQVFGSAVKKPVNILFGTGWVIIGAHPLLKSSSHNDEGNA